LAFDPKALTALRYQASGSDDEGQRHFDKRLKSMLGRVPCCFFATPHPFAIHAAQKLFNVRGAKPA
jgi:hypothetical protein